MGRCDMGSAARYGKPNMTNLPSELGKAIFRQILSTPAPDREKLSMESRKLERAIAEELKKEDMYQAI